PIVYYLSLCLIAFLLSIFLFVIVIPCTPTSTLFPYTTLFRSRQEAEGLARYCHVGTGNYHPKTARGYEDFGLLTKDTAVADEALDRKSTRLNSSHVSISYAVFCLKKKKI